MAEILLGDIKCDDRHIEAPSTANIGQTIVVKEVDESGKPISWEAVDIGTGGGTSKEWELVASYVHSGNRKIQPTALDKTTGYFTCENHGLITGDYIIPSYKIEDQIYCPIPFELVLKANYLADTIYPIRNAVTVIDDNTFMVTGKTSYAETNNTQVDVTKFYFETQNEDFSGFNNLDIDLNTHDVKIIAHDFGKRVNIAVNNFGFGKYRWLTMNAGHEFGLCQGIPITPLGGVESYGIVVLYLKNGILYGKSQQSMYPIVLKSNALEYSRPPRNHQYYCPILKEGNNITTLNKITFNTYYDKDIKPKNGGWIEIWKRKK